MSAFIVKVAVISSALASAPIVFADNTMPSPPPSESAIDQLRREMAAMELRHDAEIAALRNQNGDKWLSQQRAEEIRALVKDVLADSETRSSLQDTGATSGYKNGFFIASPDGNYKLVINSLLQARAVYNYQPTTSRFNSTQGESNEYGFEMRRVELVFAGNVVDPSWTYMVKLAFNQNGLTTQTTTAATSITNAPALEDAFIRKDFGNGFAIRAGQWKAQYNIDEIVSSKALQFAERAVNSSYFKTDFIQGIELQYEAANWRALINYNDGGGNRNIAAIGSNTSAAGAGANSANSTEWATSGRVDLKLAGDWKQFKEYMSFRGSDDGLMVGAAYNWQRGGSNNLTNPAMIGNSPGINFSYTADVSARLNGASFTASFLGNSYYARPTGLAAVNSYGALVQGGYFVSDDLELIGRWEWLNVSGGTTAVSSIGAAGDASAINAQHFQIYSVGANYYLKGNTLKLTGDVGYVVGALLFQNGLYGSNIIGANYRADENSGATGQVVARVQLQVYF